MSNGQYDFGLITYSIAYDLDLVPVLIFDIVFLCFVKYYMNIFAFPSLYLNIKPLSLISSWFVGLVY